MSSSSARAPTISPLLAATSSIIAATCPSRDTINGINCGRIFVVNTLNVGKWLHHACGI